VCVAGQLGRLFVATISIGSRVLNRIIFLGLSSAGAICCLVPRPALAAADQVGITVTVRNDVSQVEPNKSKIMAGDDVIRDEVIQTVGDSGAKFVLKDSTNLVLGPNSKLKLDKAVFSDEKGIGDIAIKLTSGSFRFITGNGPKESYAITTPLATIGIRGTILDFKLEALQNEVKLVEGQSRICAGGKCVELVNVGDSAVIKSYGGQIDIDVVTTSTTFDWGNMGSQMSFAQAGDVTGSIGGGGGGGGGTQNGPPSGGGPNLGIGPIGGSTSTTNGATGLLIGSVGALGGGGGFDTPSPR
jgi:hypothetical protein